MHLPFAINSGKFTVCLPFTVNILYRGFYDQTMAVKMVNTTINGKSLLTVGNPMQTQTMNVFHPYTRKD